MLIEVSVLPLPTTTDYYHNLKGRVVRFVGFDDYKRDSTGNVYPIDKDWRLIVEFYKEVEKERCQILQLKKDEVEFIWKIKQH